MKGFCLALLCFVAVVQGRSTGIQTSNNALATLGENPWLVHLRLAVSTSGLLNSCAGSLIDSRWFLTSASCVENATYIWVRYGVVTVINPELVTETNSVRPHPSYNPETGDDNVALVGINRDVHSTENISPIPVLKTVVATVVGSSRFCAFGANEAGGPGEHVSCINLDLTLEGANIVANSEDGQTTRYDLGAPLITDGVQVGLLTRAPGPDDEDAGVFVYLPPYVDWIESEAEITL